MPSARSADLNTNAIPDECEEGVIVEPTCGALGCGAGMFGMLPAMFVGVAALADSPADVAVGDCQPNPGAWVKLRFLNSLRVLGLPGVFEYIKVSEFICYR